MRDGERWPGQYEMIEAIEQRPHNERPSRFDLDQMTREELQREFDRVPTRPLKAPQAHHGATRHLPVNIDPDAARIPFVAKPIDQLPAWAQAAARANPTRRIGAKRYRAVIWDAERCLTVHLGLFDTPEARDAAVAAARERRAAGLPLRG